MEYGDETVRRILSDLRPTGTVEQAKALVSARQRLLGIGTGSFALGRYIVLDALGVGAHGEVYRAYDPKLGRNVALKILRQIDARGRRRLIREARTLAKIEHPNIVGVYDFEVVTSLANGIVSSDLLVMVMELVEGRTLRVWLKGDSPGWHEVIEVVKAIARGLLAAHERGIIHRDIKPSNIMLDGRGRPRVLDFGISTAGASVVERDDDGWTRRTVRDGARDSSTSAMAGTPAFMAPEQHRGESVDHRADQFSLCVVAWESLFGESPYCGATPAELVAAKVAGPPDAPRASQVPQWVVKILRRGMDPRAECRFPDLRSLLDEITRRERVRRLVTAAVVIALIAVLIGVFRWHDLRTRMKCDEAGAGIQTVWNHEIRGQLRQDFERVGTKIAMDGLRTLERRLDEYASGWRHEKTTACEALARGSITGAEVHRRSSCLDRQVAELGARLRIISGVSPHLQVQLVLDHGLDPTHCGDDSGGSAGVPAGGARKRTASVDRDIADASQQLLRGHHREARTTAERAHRAALEVGDALGRSRAAKIIAGAYAQDGRHSESTKWLRKAWIAAEQGGAQSWANLVLLDYVHRLYYFAANDASSPRDEDVASTLLELAEARVVGAGAVDSNSIQDVKAHYLLERARAERAAARNENEAALRGFERAFELLLRSDGESIAQQKTVYADILERIGIFALRSGETVKGWESLERGTAAMMKLRGAEDLYASLMLARMSLLEQEFGRYRSARRHLLNYREQKRASGEDKSMSALYTTCSLALAEAHLDHMLVAQEIADEVLGFVEDDDDDGLRSIAAHCAAAKAFALRVDGEHEAAFRSLDDNFEALDDGSGPNYRISLERGRVLIALDDLAGARAELLSSVKGMRSQYGDTWYPTVEPLMELVRIADVPLDEGSLVMFRDAARLCDIPHDDGRFCAWVHLFQGERSLRQGEKIAAAYALQHAHQQSEETRGSVPYADDFGARMLAATSELRGRFGSALSYGEDEKRKGDTP